MSITAVDNFDENQIPVEGSPTFRVDASYVWSTIPAVITSMNASIVGINSAVTTINGQVTEVATNTQNVAENKALTETYKNEALSAKQAIEGYVVPSEATYTIAQIDAQQLLDVKVTDIGTTVLAPDGDGSGLSGIKSTPVSIPASRALYGDTSLNGSDVEITDMALMYSNGFDGTSGAINTTEEFAGTTTIVPSGGWLEGIDYLKHTEGSSANDWTPTLVKPTFEIVNPISGGDSYINGQWFNDVFTYSGDGSLNASTTDAVPTMTSLTSPSGMTFGNFTSGDHYESFYAFDGVNNAVGGFYSNNTSKYVGYKWDAQKVINKYSVSMSTNNANAGAMADTWQLQMSNDTTDGTDGTWDDIGSLVSGQSFSLGEKKYYAVSNSTPYYACRLYDATVGNFYVSELEFIEAQYTVASTLYNPQITYLTNKERLVSVNVDAGIPSEVLEDDFYPETVMNSLQVKEIVANEFIGDGALTGMVVFDATTTTPTIINSFNVSDVGKTSSGKFRIYINDFIDANYSATVTSEGGDAIGSFPYAGGEVTKDYFDVGTYSGSYVDRYKVSVHIYGGKK